MIMVPHIPNEIIFNICSRLPAKSIGQFRCVSTAWRDILSTTQFIKTHLTHTQQQKSVSLIGGFPFFACLTFTNDRHVSEEIAVSSKLLGLRSHPSFRTRTKILCSCDGLLLVENNNYVRSNTCRRLFLINLTTQDFIEVPRSPFGNSKSAGYTIHGLGYDSVHDDYKVVAVSLYRSSSFVHIYSSKNGAWKMCESPLYNDLGLVIEYLDSGTYADNCIHWLARRARDNSVVIAAFNVEDERFYELKTPLSLQQLFVWYHYLEVLAGCLCICRSERPEVWMMKVCGTQMSWIKLVISEPMKYECFSPICMLGLEDLILMKIQSGFCSEEKLVAYNLKTKSFQEVVARGTLHNDFVSWKPFIETLVSPHPINKPK